MSIERLSESKEKLYQPGKILFITKDASLIKRQLNGEILGNISQSELMEGISTDEIIPNKVCLSYAGKEEGYLGQNALTGLGEGIIKPGDLLKGSFDVLVAGSSFARGSSRIHAPLALKEAGIKVIIAQAERIFEENCINCGIYLVGEKKEVAKKLLEGLIVAEDEILEALPKIYQEIMRRGGLLPYLKAIDEKKLPVPEINTQLRPMTIAEKIIARNVVNEKDELGVKAVKPGDECIVKGDLYYGYELQSPPARKALNDLFGQNIPIRRKEAIFLHNDHTALWQNEAGKIQREAQTEFAKPLGITIYEMDDKTGAPAICHTKMLQDHALPGQLILGNDSHTCTLGVINALAIGKGAIDLAGAIAYDKMVTIVPESIRINLHGKLPKNVTLKDFMLQFGANQDLKSNHLGSGRIFEFGGEALSKIPFDEQIKLTNMSIELLGFSGVIEPNEQIIKFFEIKRKISRQKIEELMVKSDKNAEYAAVFNIDLSTIEPYVATPGDTQNGQALSEIEKQGIKIQKAYIGSCTHGTPEDLRQAAEVLKGRKVANGIKLYVQASSEDNLRESVEKGYIKTLLDAGAELLPIGCGACMNAGPGSTEEGEIGIFATNRNFPGRTGRGQTYLASPIVVAASAAKGTICGPDSL